MSATWPRSPPHAYPGERLIVCRNPLLADERARKREVLLQATERDLGTILATTGRTKRRMCHSTW